MFVFVLRSREKEGGGEQISLFWIKSKIKRFSELGDAPRQHVENQNTCRTLTIPTRVSHTVSFAGSLSNICQRINPKK